MPQSIEELSYQLTTDALAEQERALSALRARAGTVIAAASVSGSFLAPKAASGSLDVWGWLAVFAFVACVGCCLAVLLPHNFNFATSGQALLATSDHLDVEDVVEAYRALTIWLEPPLAKNRDQIERLSRWFSFSCVMLALEVVLWTLSLAS